MAELKIENLDDESRLRAYRALRNRVRSLMVGTVYGGCIDAEAAFDELSSALEGDMSDFAEYHMGITAEVQPHIDAIRSAMTTITRTMEAIEKAAPGMFGIELPAESDSETAE